MSNRFGFTGKSTVITDFADKVSKSYYILLNGFGTFFFAIGGAYAGSYDIQTHWQSYSGFFGCIVFIITCPYLFLLLGLITYLYGSKGVYDDQKIQSKAIKQLEKEIAELDDVKNSLNSTQEELQKSNNERWELHVELVTNWLSGFSTDFKFGSEHRISIYYVFDDNFYYLSRYSQNPVYNKAHRITFPVNEGAISKAWQQGEYIDNTCPHFSKQQNYEEHFHKEYNFNSDRVASLTMKSCRYYSKAITDARKRIGVIVIESTNEDAFQADKLQEIGNYLQKNESVLCKFIRDSLKYDRQILIKTEGKEVDVEEDIINELNSEVAQ